MRRVILFLFAVALMLRAFDENILYFYTPVQVLAGENGSYPAAERSPIHPYERCVECVLQIQRGGRPLPSVEEIEDLLEAGRWSHRRFRRGARRDQRDLRESEF